MGSLLESPRRNTTLPASYFQPSETYITFLISRIILKCEICFSNRKIVIIIIIIITINLRKMTAINLTISSLIKYEMMKHAYHKVCITARGSDRLMLIIPAAWQVRLGGSWFKVKLGKKLMRPQLSQ
jgi:hypothetical protein